MTNHAFHHVGGGRSASLRSPASGGSAVALLTSLGLFFCALPAWAAEIVEVRVGKHSTFTRVVFELDRAAGYRIERSDPSLEITELIVLLEATSIPRSITSKKTLIEQVEIEPLGSRSIARVRLAKNGIRLKEMILTSPPRIVLDLLNDEPVVAAKPATTPTSAGAVAPVIAAEDQSFEDVVGQIGVERSPAAEPVEDENPVSVVPEVAFDTPLPAADPAPFEQTEHGVAQAPEVVVADEPSTSVPVEESAHSEAVFEEALAEEVAETSPSLGLRPMVAKTALVEEGGDGMSRGLAGAGAAVLVLGLGLVALRRRRAADTDQDGDAADDGTGRREGDNVAAPVGANPFGKAGEQTVLSAHEETAVPPTRVGDDGEASTIVLVPDEEKQSESVVFDSEENGVDDMEVISRERANQNLVGSEMPPPMGAVPEEFQQLFVAMTRRMETLEVRCDELVDARDRLERQVAAQTEELRVQRAAIARTQRAVRNLGRGEETEEQDATESGFRDPNQ